MELLVFAVRKENSDVGAICPEKGERSHVPMAIHADPCSRDAMANDILGVIFQIANPQPPTKDATVGDVRFVIQCWQIILDNVPHRFHGELIHLWDALPNVGLEGNGR